MSTMNIVTYALTGILLFISLMKSREKTKQTLKIALNALKTTAPSLLALIGFVGITLGIITPETISRVLGESSGTAGTLMAALIGAVTLMPAIAAFPLAGTLLRSGANMATVSAFISSAVMVGLATIPVEIKSFGKKFTMIRNTLSFLLALLLAWIVGAIL